MHSRRWFIRFLRFPKTDRSQIMRSWLNAVDKTQVLTTRKRNRPSWPGLTVLLASSVSRRLDSSLSWGSLAYLLNRFRNQRAATSSVPDQCLGLAPETRPAASALSAGSAPSPASAESARALENRVSGNETRQETQAASQRSAVRPSFSRLEKRPGWVAMRTLSTWICWDVMA